MSSTEIAFRYQGTAARYQESAAFYFDLAVRQGDPAEKATLLGTARLWVALAALARKMANVA